MRTDNGIGAEGCRALCEALKNNDTLTKLNISCNETFAGQNSVASSEHLKSYTGNNIGIDGCRMIVGVLETNISLVDVDLAREKRRQEKTVFGFSPMGMTGNAIGDDGAKMISETLKNNVFLTALNLECVSSVLAE